MTVRPAGARVSIAGVAFAACLSGQSAIAQSSQSPPKAPERQYQSNIANEDWSFLADPAKRTDELDSVKYIPFNRNRWFLSLGGEVRFRPEGLRLFGPAGQPDLVDHYFLQRYLIAPSLNFGPRARVYAEIQSGIIDGKISSPRPTDEDRVDLHQAFLEFRSAKSGLRVWVVRLGRQELAVGSSRLIDPSQGLNVKRSFDGANGIFKQGPWTVEGGAARLVKVQPGAFDDPWDRSQTFWAVAGSRAGFPWPAGIAGLYYLGIDRAFSTYVQGTAPERRHTIGGHLAGRWRRLDANYDLLGQWGHFGPSPIRAWAVATETGLRFPTWRFTPRVSVRSNAASGDADAANPHLETFDPLFPGSAYSGLVGLLGPANLTDLTPSVQVSLTPRFQLVGESPFYWRLRTHDGIYGTDLRVLFDGTANDRRFVGYNPGVVFNWRIRMHVTVAGATTKFRSGPFLDGSPLARGFRFSSLTFIYRF